MTAGRAARTVAPRLTRGRINVARVFKARVKCEAACPPVQKMEGAVVLRCAFQGHRKIENNEHDYPIKKKIVTLKDQPPQASR